MDNGISDGLSDSGLTKEQEAKKNEITRKIIKGEIENLGECLLEWLDGASETDLSFFTYEGEEGLDVIRFESEQKEHATELLTWVREPITTDGGARRNIEVQPIRRTVLDTPFGTTTIIVEHSPVCGVASMETLTEDEIRYQVDIAKTYGMSDVCLKQLEEFLRGCLKQREAELSVG